MVAGLTPSVTLGGNWVQNHAPATDCDHNVMSNPQQQSEWAQVAQLLPPTWDVDRDILLIVGEGAAQIAKPFLSYGLKRVWVMTPAPLSPETGPSGATTLHSRGALHRAIQTMPGEAAGTLALLRTPACSIPQSDTRAIRSLAMSLLKRKPANEHIHSGLAPLWAMNGLANLVQVGRRPLVSDLDDDLAGVPLIIVGAGPSLAKNIGQLKAAQDKAIIVCTARALNSLQAEGVMPDFAISLDAIDIKSHFRGIRTSEIPGLHLSLTSNPNLFELEHPGIIGFSANTEAEAWMLDPADQLVETPSGGSVSCSAMSIGLLWRCDPIIMVGQDLAFDQGAVYHSAGTDGGTTVTLDPATNTWTFEGFSDDLAHSLRHQLKDGALSANAAEVPGYYGGTVPTTPEFAVARQWFEFTAQDETGKTRLFNCTEGGAYIEGMHHAPLAEVLDALPDRRVSTSRIVSQLASLPQLSDRASRLKSKATSCRAAIRAVTDLARACVAQIDAVPSQAGALERLQHLEEELSPALQHAFVLNVAAQADIREAMKQGAEAKSLAESLATSRRLYTVLADWGERLTAQ